MEILGRRFGVIIRNVPPPIAQAGTARPAGGRTSAFGEIDLAAGESTADAWAGLAGGHVALQLALQSLLAYRHYFNVYIGVYLSP